MKDISKKEEGLVYIGFFLGSGLTSILGIIWPIGVIFLIVGIFLYIRFGIKYVFIK